MVAEAKEPLIDHKIRNVLLMEHTIKLYVYYSSILKLFVLQFDAYSPKACPNNYINASMYTL